MFPKVKDGNVRSLKIRSKLLDFSWVGKSDETAGRREEETKRGRDGGSEEACHLLLPFPVLRSLRL